MAGKSGSGAVKWIVVLLLLGGAGYGGWRWYQGRSAEEPIQFRTAKVTRGDIVQSVSANGSLAALKSVAVGSQVSGQITNVTVDFNSRVTEGQLLAQIDAATYVTKVSEAKANLSNAKAALRLTEVNYARSKELYTAGLVSRSEYDQTEVSLEQARASVELRESALSTAEVDLSRTSIYAPISGIVISRNIDVGQTVAASLNTPTLFVLVNDLSTMEIGALVSEADIGGIDVGQQVTFNVDAFPGREFRGEIRQVRYAAVTNQNVVSYATVVNVNNQDLKLRPGMTATANIITAQKTGVLRLPKSALRTKPPESALLKVASTNALSSEASSPSETPRSAAPGEMATPPWAAEGRRPTDEERQKWMASLTPEQQQQMQQMRERMRTQGGGGERRGGGGEGGAFGGFGGFGGRGGAPRQAVDNTPKFQTIYTLVTTNTPDGKTRQLAKPLRVKTGAEDSTFVEVLEGLSENDEVITGLVSTTTTPAASPMGGNPFSPAGGMRMR
jgi:HlyD family secretion protein